MKNKRWVPRVGEVVKYRRSGEVLYRYGRVHAIEGSCYAPMVSLGLAFA